MTVFGEPDRPQSGSDTGPRPGLHGTRFGPVRHVIETGSTNADLLAEVVAGAKEGAVLFTDHQTAGRGRQRRAWHDDPGNALLVSVLLRPAAAIAGLVPLITGLAAVDALSALGSAAAGAGPGRAEGEPTSVGLKWPNDVLASDLEERKLAGILAESVTAASTTGQGRLAVVTGMGMNLRWSSPPPPEIVERAATVTELLGRPVDRDEVLERYLVGLERWLAEAEAGGPRAVIAGYRSVCLTVGRRVRFATAEGDHTGRAVDVTEAGLLVLERDDGRRVELAAGDAHHLPIDEGL